MEYFTILSFDPGLSTSGFNISKYNTDERIMHIEHCGVLYPNSDVFLSKNKINAIRYGHRIMTLNQLKKDVCFLIDTYCPDFVVTEDAFYNPSRPTAYCALIQWITTVSMLLCNKYNMTLFKLAPKIAKQIISGFGESAKEGVQAAVIEKKDIKFNPSIDVNALAEHTFDSIGIGYTFIQEILPSIMEIWSNLNGEETQKIYRR